MCTLLGGRTDEFIWFEATDLDAVSDARLDENGEAVDSVNGLLQFVGLCIILWLLQTLSTKRTQQQSQEQVQHLQTKKIVSEDAALQSRSTISNAPQNLNNPSNNDLHLICRSALKAAGIDPDGGAAVARGNM